MRKLYRFKKLGGKWKVMEYDGEAIGEISFVLYITVVEATKIVTGLNRQEKEHEKGN